MLATEEALKRFRDQVVKNARTNLTKGNKNVTRSLYDSIKGFYKVMPNSIYLEFEMLPWGQFQDKGVKGAAPNRVKGGVQKAPNSPFSFKTSKTMIPTHVLDQWVIKRGIAPRDEKGKFMNRNSLKFALAKRIHAQGIKPSLFFTKAFESAYKHLPNDLIENYGLDVERQFITIIQQP